MNANHAATGTRGGAASLGRSRFCRNECDAAARTEFILRIESSCSVRKSGAAPTKPAPGHRRRHRRHRRSGIASRQVAVSTQWTYTRDDNDIHHSNGASTRDNGGASAQNMQQCIARSLHTSVSRREASPRQTDRQTEEGPPEERDALSVSPRSRPSPCIAPQPPLRLIAQPLHALTQLLCPSTRAPRLRTPTPLGLGHNTTSLGTSHE